jgi:hypothetical protein
MKEIIKMQRNNKIEQKKSEDSTGKIYNTLHVGGPPAKKPVFGPSVRVYDSEEKIKIDEEGQAYIGISVKELLKLQADEKKEKDATSPNETHSKKDTLEENGIYTLKF